MRTFDTNYQTALNNSLETGIVPVWFLWIHTRNRSTQAIVEQGVCSRDEDFVLTVPKPDGTTSASRTYWGDVGLEVGEITNSLALEDVGQSLRLDPLSPVVQSLFRSFDLRHAYVELHTGILNGGALVSPPQLVGVGLIDVSSEQIPAVGGEASLSLTIGDDFMDQLTQINPAKSSDAHQKRRQAGDLFSQYSGVVGSRELQWYK